MTMFLNGSVDPEGFELSTGFFQGLNGGAPFSEAWKTSGNPRTKYSPL